MTFLGESRTAIHSELRNALRRTSQEAWLALRIDAEAEFPLYYTHLVPEDSRAKKGADQILTLRAFIHPPA